jgi:hypothetical protein
VEALQLEALSELLDEQLCTQVQLHPRFWRLLLWRARRLERCGAAFL